MSDSGSTPRYIPEHERGVKSIVTRITLAEHASLLKLLHDDDLTVQSFLSACVIAYIRGDRTAQTLVEQYKRLRESSAEKRAGHVLSKKDRLALFDEIEKLEGDE